MLFFNKDPYYDNKKGMRYEKLNVKLATIFYEKAISQNFEGNHPYDRLAIIYRKQKDYLNEIRVLNKAIEVFENLKKTSPRTDIKPKLEKFRIRLEKATKLMEKTKDKDICSARDK